MGRTCKEVHDWIEETIEKPIEDWEKKKEKKCREEKCKWWMGCLNKLFCWFIWVWVKIFRIIYVTIGKWVIRVVCETVNIALDVVGWVINSILAIPIVGGTLRLIWNWVIEGIWRILGLPELIASLLGLRLRKKMYFGVIIPTVDGVPVATPAQMQPQVDYAISAYDSLCNIDLRFTGYCMSRIKPPKAARNLECGLSGFFHDLWVAGLYFQGTINLCRFKSNWRRIVGAGGEIFVFVMPNVEPDTIETRTVGCSMTGSQDYVVVEPGASADTTAHEIGHACLLGHRSGAPDNLMTSSNMIGGPVLTDWQIAVIRSSRHCVYL